MDRKQGLVPLRPAQDAGYSLKVKFLLVSIGLLFCLIAARLFYLQLIQGSSFRQKAINNRKQIVRLPAYRGEIYLETGKVKVVENLPTYSLYLTPYHLPRHRKGEKFKALFQKLTNKFDINTNVFAAILRRGRANPYKTYLLKPVLSAAQVAYLAEHLADFPGLSYLDSFNRYYRQPELFSHITGYIRPISARELRRKKYQQYSPSSLIGKLGVESYYDLELRGVDGYKIQLVDAKARLKEEYFPAEGLPVPGRALYLTIDPKIQTVVYQTLKGYVGGALVTRVKTGEILALYSYPDYDPNIFTGKLEQEKFEAYRNDKRNPFLNRVTQATYPPSSVYKLVVSLIAFDTQENFQNTKHACYGGLYIGSSYFKCTRNQKLTDYRQALAYSDNIFFYKVGLAVGPDLLHKYTYDYFNLGRKTGIDLPFERSGRVPSQQWKLEARGVYWWDGDTANLSIGQGYMLTSVAQINTLTAAIAGDGIAYRPHLLKYSRSLATGERYQNTPPELLQLPFSKPALRRIQSAMHAVTQFGTARRLSKQISTKVAGKTGTAQNLKFKEPHSWFTAYAPYQSKNPAEMVAVTVMIENGGAGSSLAAPFAAAIIEAIFKNKAPLLTLKEYYQNWERHEKFYQEWLKIKKQTPLPEEHFIKS